MLRYVALVLVGLVIGGGGASGEPAISLRFPVDCTLGADCWLFQYFDHDTGPGARDYACGSRSYDGHTGTDIALRDAAAIEADVAVLAAATGVVRATRDGLRDRLYGQDNAAATAGKECGNGVAITHDGGWETQYCHLRRGSIRVREGERVAQGARLGSIGLSGRTQFPHLEIVVRHEGKAVDPFTGTAAANAGCGPGPGALWKGNGSRDLRYSPVDVLAVGISSAPPSPDDAHAGRLHATSLNADAPVLAAWATIAGVRAGDRLRLSLYAPDGRIVATDERALDRTQIRYFMFVGRRATRSRWPGGDYLAAVELARGDGVGAIRRTAEVMVPVR